MSRHLKSISDRLKALWRRIDSHLISDWRHAHKKFSVQMAVVISLANGMWVIWPNAAGIVPFWVLALVSCILAVILGLGRLVRQGGAR